MPGISEITMPNHPSSVHESADQPRSLYLACPVLLAIVLGLSLAIPHGIVIYAFYAIAVVSALLTWDRRFVREMALAAAVFVMLDAALLQQPVNGALERFVNFIVGLLGIWAALHLCLEAITAYENRVKEQVRQAQALAEAGEMAGHVVMLCAWTKRVKEDGQWVPMEEFLQRHLHVRISHGVSDDVRDQLVRAIARKKSQEKPPEESAPE
jgi:hypothetical protein